VITTVFSTRCWNDARLEWAAWLACALLAFSALLPIKARAASVAQVTEMRLERSEEGIFLAAVVRLELSATVEDALLKGIPMFFVAEADVLRDRWYWYDKKVASSARYMRLTFHPLTRRWRLNVAPGPFGNTGLGVTLNQNFESLQDALAALARFSRWKIAEAAELEADARYSVDFRFRLDVSQLPRPFQIGAVGQPEWSISTSRNQRIAPEAQR